jgi:hypothetical protein
MADVPSYMPHLLHFITCRSFICGNWVGIWMRVGFISVVCPSLCLSFSPLPFSCSALCVKYTKQYEVNYKVFAIQVIKTYSGSLGKAVLALSLGTEGGEWLTSRSGRFIPGKEPRYLLNRKLGGIQCQCGRFGEEKNLLAIPWFESRAAQSLAVPTTL